jgi:hypothetical protein
LNSQCSLAEDKYYPLFPFCSCNCPNSPKPSYITNTFSSTQTLHSQQCTLQKWLNGPRDINLNPALRVLVGWWLATPELQQPSGLSPWRWTVATDFLLWLTCTGIQGLLLCWAPLCPPVWRKCPGIPHNCSINLRVVSLAGFFECDETNWYT